MAADSIPFFHMGMPLLSCFSTLQPSRTESACSTKLSISIVSESFRTSGAIVSTELEVIGSDTVDRGHVRRGALLAILSLVPNLGFLSLLPSVKLCCPLIRNRLS